MQMTKLSLLWCWWLGSNEWINVCDSVTIMLLVVFYIKKLFSCRLFAPAGWVRHQVKWVSHPALYPLRCCLVMPGVESQLLAKIPTKCRFLSRFCWFDEPVATHWKLSFSNDTERLKSFDDNPTIGFNLVFTLNPKLVSWFWESHSLAEVANYDG